jgi:hypothetical protein
LCWREMVSCGCWLELEGMERGRTKRNMLVGTLVGKLKLFDA